MLLVLTGTEIERKETLSSGCLSTELKQPSGNCLIQMKMGQELNLGLGGRAGGKEILEHRC